MRPAATDLRFEAEVLSYSRSRGLFAGVAFEGAGITMDRKANAAFYGSPSMTPEDIFASASSIAPDVAQTFVQTLGAQTGQVPSQPGMRATSVPEADSEEGTGVRTFGVPEPEDDIPDATY